MLVAGVKTDCDHNAPFATYKTFAWKSVRPTVANGMVRNSLLTSRIESAVDEQLLRRGMSEDANAPDVFLVLHVGAKERQDIQTFPWYGGRGWRRWGWAGGDVVVDHYTEGQFVVDMVDAKTGQLVWRAYCEDTGSSVLDTQSLRKVNGLITAAFKRFPPKMKS